MFRSTAILLACVLFASPLAAHASSPVHVSKRISTPSDIQAIEQVIEDFRLAIINKDGKKLSGLVLHSRIPFTSPGDQSVVDRIRERDVNFDGVSVGGFGSFSHFISTTPNKIEEKFYNVQITQDGPLAFVLFDFEFFANDKVTNHGIEHWQLHKTDGKWKIFSVIWSSNKPAQ